VVAEVMTEVGMDEGVLSGRNQWMVLLLLKTGNGLVDKTEEVFGGGEIRGREADDGGLGGGDSSNEHRIVIPKG